MEDELRHLLVDSRGSTNRVRILFAVDERPRNSHRLANDLNIEYGTVNHHLSVLIDSGLLQCSGDHYGAIYLLSDQARHYWGLIDDLAKPVGQADG